MNGSVEASILKSAYICVIRNEMIVYKTYLGEIPTFNSIKALQSQGELMPLDSWSELGFTYEKYNSEDLVRNWNRIVKSEKSLVRLDKVPTEGAWGILYES